MIFIEDTIPYLPFEQEHYGTPLELGIITPSTPLVNGLISRGGGRVVNLPDDTQMEIPVWDIPVTHHKLLLMWKVVDNYSVVDPTVRYTVSSSGYNNPDTIGLLSDEHWDKYASGRFSVWDGNSSGIYTWRKTPLEYARSWYNPIDNGGHVGLLYFENYGEDTIKLPGGFGKNVEFLQWLIIARVIGSPIYPTRALSSPTLSDKKQAVKTTSGKAQAHIKSSDKVFMCRVSFKGDPDMDICQTLEAINPLSRLIMLPCGLDTFSETQYPEFRRPGFARYMTVTTPASIRGYDDGLDTGEAFDASITLTETIRP